MIQTNVTRHDVDQLPGRHGAKWGVSGTTQFGPDMIRADVELKVATLVAAPSTVAAIRAHELGHVAVLQDVVDAYGTDGDAWDVARTYDRWQNEVEAWLRGFDNPTPRAMTWDDATLALDCLNSYRRTLNGVTDDDWNDAVELIAAMFHGDPDAVRQYVPIEPDPDEQPPSCGLPEPRDASDDDDADDASDDADDDDASDDADDDDDASDDDADVQDGPVDDDDADDDDDGPDPDREHGFSRFDGDAADAWLQQDVMDALNDGATMSDVVDRFGLDTSAVPPLVAAMYGTP